MNDEELQNKIEKGQIGNSPDEKAYHMVFGVLKKEITYQLPSDFAGKVIRSMQAVSQQSTAREMVWLYAGLVSFVIAAGVAVTMTDFKINFGVLKFISGYPRLIVFGILFILSLQWVDKKLVRKSV